MYSQGLTSDLLSGLQSSINSTSSAVQGIQIWTIVATILAIVGAILIYFLFVKSKTNFKGFAKTLKDYLSGDLIHIESLAKMFYYAGLIYVVLTSINSLIMIGMNVDAGSCIIQFFSQLLLGPIIVRFIFEIIMMFIRIWKNTENLKKK
jgi:hypothetical protein